MSKKLKGYLLARYTNMSNSYTCKRLVEEAEKLNIDLKTIGIHDVMICGNEIYHKNKNLDKVDFIINRHKHGNLKDKLNALGERSYNNINSFNIYLDKFLQMENISSPNFLKAKYFLATADKSFGEISDILSEPFIAKGLNGSEGNEVFLIKNTEDLKSLEKSYPRDKEILFQEFITTSIGRDIRLYAIKGDAVAAMLRRTEKDFRANFALGASVEAYPIDEKLRKIAEDIYRITKLDFVGIDLLFGENDLYFCEVNVMAGIRGIEKASGLNIAGKILESIRNDFNE